MIKRFILLFVITFLFFTCKKENLKSSPIIKPDPNEQVIADPIGTQFVSWIMIWDRSSESWWNSSNTAGATIFVNGKWQSIDWKDNNQINEYIQNLKDAGITILICDLTNGWGWLDDKVQYIQTICANNGMKLCVAENSNGDISTFEGHAQDIWNKFAKPSLPNGSTYLRKDGKPVIVCYAIRSWYNSYRNSLGTNTRKFTLVWASGEDSDINKWGWQLEPWIASVPSTDAMFVTSAIKLSSQAESWRKSLSWLDYNFLLVKQNNPKYIIIGSYDDMNERNGWLVANTSNCIPGMQMRDKNGAISNDAYYNRIKEWISGNPTSIPGGYILDGCYRVINQNSGKVFNLQGGDGKIGARLIQVTKSNERLNDYYWFYHLGNNSYRIISLNSGLSLSVPNGSLADGILLEHTMDADVLYQKWTLEDAGGGYFFIKNNMSGKVLQVEGASTDTGASIIQLTKDNGTYQHWKIEEILSFKSL